MSKHSDTPATGYYVEVDIAGEPSNEAAVRNLRTSLGDTGIHVTVIELEGPGGGNPNVRLRSNSRNALYGWLKGNDYDLDVHTIVNARNPNAIARK